MGVVQLRGGASGAVLVAALFTCVPAAAEDLEAARRHFERGQEQYQREEYEQAFASYQAAFAAAPLPDFLFNMGQCQRKLGNRARAIGLYTQFVEVSPDPSRRALAEEIMAELRAEPADVPPARPDPVGSTAGSVAPDPPGGGARPSEEPRERPGPLARIRLATWLVLGGGVVLLGVGGYFGLQVLDAQSEIESTDCEVEGVRCLQLQDEGNSDFTKQIVFQALGGAALALTAVLVILDVTSEPAAPGSAFVAPRLARGGFIVEGGARW